MFIHSNYNALWGGKANGLAKSASRAPQMRQTGRNDRKMQGYMRDITSVLKRLKDAVGCVKAAPVFMGPQSTDTRAVELSYTGSKFDSFAPIKMEVKQEARTRQNLSFGQNISSADYAAGTHTFAIDLANGKSVELSVDVKAGESNEAVQRKMAEAVNRAGIGLRAEVGLFTDPGTGNTLATLSIETEGMGDDAVGFSVRDVNGSLVHSSGINRLAHEAQNAIYTVDGVNHTSTSNVVEVGNGITATIRCASVGAFEINDGFHEINAQNMLSILYAPLNDLKTIAEDMQKTKGIDTLSLQIAALFSETEAVLGNFGVFINTDGIFDINPTKVGAALADGSLRAFLQDFYENGGGFIAALEAFANNALQNPGSLFSGTPFTYTADAKGVADTGSQFNRKA